MKCLRLFFPQWRTTLEFFLIFLTCCGVFADEINKIFKYRNRNERRCQKLSSDLEPFYRSNIFEDPFYLILLMVLGILFILLFLGRYFINRFTERPDRTVLYKKIGESGMSLLIDLPKPLNQYQENNLKQRPVEYDAGGWPIHPDTKKRTVRFLPIKTEFCLNIIFFLAYPLALILRICGLLCCAKNRNEKGEPGTYTKVNVTKVEQDRKDSKPGRNVDKYSDNDKKEAQDTKYVVNMLRLSQISLQK